jgi:peptidyl-prolyl cis-trans isomerase D
MAILEKIRKRTTVLILIIGLALFAFVISGIFTSKNFSGAKVGSSIADINGKEISIDEFRAKMERASQRSAPNTTSTQIINGVWNQLLRSTILEQEMEDLGISIEQDQIINVIKSNPGITQNPQFQDENGAFDEAKFRDFIADLRTNAPAQYQDWLQDEASIVQSAKEQTYFDLIRAGVGATLKEGEFDYKLTSDKVDIEYARYPFSSIADSTIIIGKEQISAYVREHEDQFKQEKGRDIQLVYFEEKASAGDEAAIKEEILNLLQDRQEYNQDRDTTETIAGFRNTTSIAEFLRRHSDTEFDTIYKSRKDLPTQFADTLMALQVGELFGPYRDAGAFKVSRMVAKKANGSVKASHILISYKGAERANPNISRTRDEAEKRAEELLAEAKKEGTVFAELARDNSDGPSAPQGGDLGYFQEGVMTPKFNDFAFENPVGYIGLVETEFGYHIVKIDDKQDVVQLATLSRAIEPSEETINNLFTEATKFEMTTTSSDQSFSDLAKESNYVTRPVNKLKPMDEMLPGLGAQRAVVQWAFNEDTNVGDIKRFNINNGYAVVQLTGKYKEGLMSPEDASSIVLPILRKEKKAERIIADNQGKSMEEFASSNNISVASATSVTVKSPTIPGAGREPLVVGTAFSMAEGATSGLIKGETGVFMIRLKKKEEAPKLDNYSTYANSIQSSNAARVNTEVYNALREKAEIEDNRSVFY